MDDFELILTMLGERTTTEIHRTEDSKGIPKLQQDAKAGGKVAGGTRKLLEKQLMVTVLNTQTIGAAKLLVTIRRSSI